MYWKTKILILKNIYNLPKATADDVDEAYRAAALAKKKWDAVNPFEKRNILEKAVTYIEENEEAIIYLIMEELGGTRLKAAFEIGLVKNIMKEAATFLSAWKEKFFRQQ